MTESFIITAGGKGLRMGADIPKQFIELRGKPILMHTIEKFHNYNPQAQLILVLPESHINFWIELTEKHSFQIPHELVTGGKERFFSIKNGLDKVTGEMVGVHDGVRPFVSLSVIKNLMSEAQSKKAVIPVINIKESVRKMDGETSTAVNRSDYKLVQTPQCFETALLKKAYQQDYKDEFTDDASVVEQLGHSIFLCDGNEENIKITTPLDLKMADFINSQL